MHRGRQLFPTVGSSGSNPLGFPINLKDATAVALRIFANDTDWYRCNQLKHYVKMVLRNTPPFLPSAASMQGF